MGNRPNARSLVVYELIPEFFSDGEVHGIQELIDYAIEKKPNAGITRNHVSCAVHHAKTRGTIVGLGQGRYQRSANYYISGTKQTMTNMENILDRIQRVSAMLDWKTNVFSLSRQEFDVIQKIQQLKAQLDELYEEIIHQLEESS